jgi:phytoene synthase
MKDAAIQSAAATIKRNGKSFWFASLFLPRHTAIDSARLYAFCRTMDDLADVAVTESSRETLAEVRSDLQLGNSHDPIVADFLTLARKYALPLSAADYLIATFIEDATTELHIKDEYDLVRYCYGVAGTVGLMMSPILGAGLPHAGEAAIHLGIAMQMTNIARDVLEDAQNGRRYLPGCWVDQTTARQIATETALRPKVAAAVAQLLELADRYYASAALGFPLIPAGSRRGIEIAAMVYREIGNGLRRNQYAWWNGRVTVPLWWKLSIAVGVYLGLSGLRLKADIRIVDLSLPLAGLPGAQ